MALTEPQLEHYRKARRLNDQAEHNQGPMGTRELMAQLAATHARLAAIAATAAEAAEEGGTA